MWLSLVVTSATAAGGGYRERAVGAAVEIYRALVRSVNFGNRKRQLRSSAVKPMPQISSFAQLNIEMWLSLVERCVRDAEAAGSNPVISTKIGNPLMKIGGFLILYYSFFIIQYSSFIKTDFRNE